MSWLYSQALVEEYSAATCSDGEPSAQLSVMPTPHPFWRNDKTTDFSGPSRFGLTCAVLTEDRGAELLMLYLAAFRAKTSARPGKAQASTARAPASGVKWRELSVRYDRDSSSWKTHQLLFQEDLEWSSVTFPKWGMTADGVLWERMTQALPMSASAPGSWPTPRANDSKKADSCDAMNPRNGLAGAVLRWPTPIATEWKNGRGRTGNRDQAKKDRAGLKLSEAVRMWPTPTAHNAKEGGHPSEHERNTPTLAAQAGGALNPTWVEWLMGWPLGWTDLEPLETDKFQQWRRSHGAS